jgi:hypothetical protein
MTEPELRRLLDERQIQRTLATYCKAIDRRDEELLRSVYGTGAYDDHGTFKGSSGEFVNSLLNTVLQQFSATTHLLGNSLIDVDGDRARAETYFLAFHVIATGEPPSDEGEILTFAGRYLDRFTREDGRWLITRRTVVCDWTERTRSAPWSAQRVQPFAQGRPDRSDPVFGDKDLVSQPVPGRRADGCAAAMPAQRVRVRAGRGNAVGLVR